MRKFIIAAAALAAFASAPAFAGEGTFEPKVTASGFMARLMASANESMKLGTSFQYNNAGNYGDTYAPDTTRPVSWLSGRISPTAFSYSMTNGNG
jgi:hypothetical protein